MATRDLFLFVFCCFCFFLPIIHYRRPSDKRLDWQLINKNAGATLSRLTFRVTCQLVLFSDQSSFWLFSFPWLFFLIVVSLFLSLSLVAIVQSPLISCQLMNWWWMTPIMTRELVQCNLWSWFISSLPVRKWWCPSFVPTPSRFRLPISQKLFAT